MTRILFVTDLEYVARGRDYGAEDRDLIARLAAHFDLSVCRPEQAETLMAGYDAVVLRDTGPVSGYLAAYESFRAAVRATWQPVFTQLTGRADQAGKHYLLDLFAAGDPVIPTVSAGASLDLIPAAEQYIVKPRLGADSHGLRVLTAAEARSVDEPDVLLQPRIPFAYEVSFYYVDDAFQYALHAPDPARRWDLAPYSPTPADLTFADRFIAWNTIDHGIQRVDAMRAPDGELLLVELEDLNPYLSLHLLTEDQRRHFVDAMVASIEALVAR